MDSNEFKAKIAELEKMYYGRKSELDGIGKQITKAKEEYHEFLRNDLRDRFVGKYFKVECSNIWTEYVFVRDINDSTDFVCDRICFRFDSYNNEVHIDHNQDYSYIESDMLQEITKEEFMTIYDNACKKMLSCGFGEPNQ